MSFDKEKELQQLQNRLRELAGKSYQQNIFTFTGFLGLSEQDVFWRMEKEFAPMGYTFWGGCENADRGMVRFGSVEELGYEVPFPIQCLHITPISARFADALSHRDFLGALMNLGIERSTIGDIKVGDKEAYLFCQDSITDYICSNLEQIKHTHVKCVVTEDYGEIPQEEPAKCIIQVNSLRVDAVIAKVYNQSREKSLALFQAGRVFVDGRLCENNSRLLKAGETVNARGFGKFILAAEPKETRKGKMQAEVSVYR